MHYEESTKNKKYELGEKSFLYFTVSRLTPVWVFFVGRGLILEAECPE